MRAPRPWSPFLGLVVVLPLLVCPATAVAHARLVRTSPASETQAAAPPERIELWFSELLEDGFNSVEVVPVADLAAKPRPNAARGAPTVDRLDRTHLVVPVERLGAGRYAVEWRVLSRDGHTATGRFTFAIRPTP